MRRQQCRRDNARGSRKCSGCDVAVTWPEKKSLDLFHLIQVQEDPVIRRLSDAQYDTLTERRDFDVRKINGW
jgi:hypothetical protein